jgi:hypothetical protein
MTSRRATSTVTPVRSGAAALERADSVAVDRFEYNAGFPAARS